MTRRLLPWIVLVVCVASLTVPAMLGPRTSADGMRMADFGRLPVSLNGRVQPFDSVARVALLRIRGSAAVPLQGAQAVEARATTLDASRWLLELLAKPEAADGRRIFPIRDPKVIAKLSLGPAGTGTSYFAFRDLAPKVADIGKETQRIGKVKPGSRAGWEMELVALHERLAIYERLKNSVQPNSLLQRNAKGGALAFDFANELTRYKSDLSEAVRVATRRQFGGVEVLDPPTEQRLRTFSGRFQGASRIAALAVVPPVQREGERTAWVTTPSAIVSASHNGRLPAPVAYFAAMTSAFAQGKAAAFNDRVTRYQRWLAANGFGGEVGRARFEALYDEFQPFVKALAVYALGLALLVVGWIARSQPTRRSAAMLILVGFSLHTAGIAFAAALAPRLSIIMLGGWAAALVGAVVEPVRRRGVGLAVAAGAGLVVLGTGSALEPGGASALLRQALDLRLLLALVVTLSVVSLVRGRRWQASAASPVGGRTAKAFPSAI